MTQVSDEAKIRKEKILNTYQILPFLNIGKVTLTCI